MTTIRYGNIDNLYVNDDNGIGNTIIIGSGINDIVIAIGSQNDTITLGNGAGDTVNFGFTTYSTITLGNGAGDTVSGFRGDFANTITLGNGAGDMVDDSNREGFGSTDKVTVGNGAGDVVTRYLRRHNNHRWQWRW